MKYLALVAMLILAGCGANDPGLAKTVKPTKAQLAALEDRIKPYGMVNIEGAMQVAQAPTMPGEAKYAACGACHGAQGGGGVGPALAGKTAEYIANRLIQYKNGEKVGSQSNMMWGQAGMLSETDITDLADYIATM
jgi:cytochrome c553